MAHAQSTAPDTAEEIVVTATRTGAPVWRVRSATGTLVLVGSIEDVAAGTNWRPAALAETVRRADRVMFPQVVGVALSPFSAINYYAKWKRRARLPNGQTLSNMMSAAEVDRLRRLAAQGLAPADFHNLHPLHLAFNMQDRLRKRTGLMEGPSTTVSRAAAKFKVARIPIRRAAARPLADSLFKSQPAEHIPCLRATIAAAEDGPGGLRARSQDWAGKRVQAALKAPAQRMGSSCWPVNTGAIDMPNLTGTARTMIGTPGTTLAVVSLDTLARPNGLLDALRAGGYQVDGPAWR
jgi:hypothetical protein